MCEDLERKDRRSDLQYDSEEPEESFRDFLMGEVRYASLGRTSPEVADSLFTQTEQDAKDRYAQYKRLAGE